MPLIQKKKPPLKVVPRGHPPPMRNIPAPVVPPIRPGGFGSWGNDQSWGRWIPRGAGAAHPAVKAAIAKQLTDEQMIQQYTDMLTKKQKTVLDQMIADQDSKTKGGLASLAGFGAALQGYSHDLWGQTDQSYRDAAAAQTSMAQGLAGQVGSGIAGMRAQEAALAGGLGYEGTTSGVPDQGAAEQQIATEGGAKTGEMMAQVGNAWGGYGATQPEYIGFMTGQNQLQLAREGIQADKDIRSKFLELGMDNPATALDMWSKIKESKRQDASTALASQTLRTNIQMQKAKLQQAWYTARTRAKTAAQKAYWDRWYKQQSVILDQQGMGIDQQNAESRAISAGASATSAGAAVTRAQTADWKAHHPQATPPKPAQYAQGTWQQKVSAAMNDLPALLEHSGGGKQGAYAFNTLWAQMAPYVDAKNKAKAKAVLRQRIRNAAKNYKPKPSGSASDPYNLGGKNG